MKKRSGMKGLGWMLALVLPGVVAGQTKNLVHPVLPEYENVDAPGSLMFAGLGGSFRQQILIAEKRLSGLRGSKITGIWLRRDAHPMVPDALSGGVASLYVRLSDGSVQPEKAAPDFGSNHKRSFVTVFNGLVTVPDSPRITAGSYGFWEGKNSIKINFSTPFPYVDGTLCVDVAGIPAVTGSRITWWLDHEFLSHGGRATSFGKSCGKTPVPFAEGYSHTLSAGSTARILFGGRKDAQAMMMFGVQAYSIPVDLASMGAPGCMLYFDPLIFLPGLTYFEAVPGAKLGISNMHPLIPSASGILGAKLLAQLAEIEPRGQLSNAAGLRTSNAVEMVVSSVQSPLGMSMVTSFEAPGMTMSSLPKTGNVDVNRAPVLRLLYR